MDAFALSSYAALKMATMGGAAALGMASEIGSIERGKRADLILVNLDRAHLRPINEIVNNLVYAGHATDVETVLIDGQIVVEKGRVCGLDEDRAFGNAEAYALQHLWQRGGKVPPFYLRAGDARSALMPLETQ
jgi:5-methylthioadenosine/S-adenosylhomocysteine deaminase